MSRRDRIALALVGVVVLAGAYWFLLLSPKRDEAAKVAGQVATQREALSTAQQQVAAYTEAKAHYGRNYATVVRLGKAVPADDDVPSLLYALSSTADRSHVAFDSFKLAGGGGSAPAPAPATGGAAVPPALPPGAVTGTAGFPTMPFNFLFEGQFFRLSDFIQHLEDYVRLGKGGAVQVGGRLLRVDGFSLKSGSAGDGASQVQATITATGFLTPEDEGLLAGATPDAPAGAAGSAAAPATGTSTGTATPPPATITGVGR